MASFWSVIVPEETTNHVLNPSFRENVTDGWSLSNGTRTQVSFWSKFGAYSCRLTAAGAGTNAIIYTDNITLPDGDTVIFSIYRYQYTADFDLLIYDATNTTGRATSTFASSTEERLTVSWENDTGGPVSVNGRVRNLAQDGTTNVWFDAAQLELSTYTTTYIDGDQPGCEWNGAPHNSTSTRSAQSREGGRVYDLEDYYFDAQGATGIGVPPITQWSQSFAVLPGGQSAGVKLGERDFTIDGFIEDGGSRSTLHDRRQDLLGILGYAAKPNNQPITLRYSGATVEKEIRARYTGGLEFNYNTSTMGEVFSEKLSLAFHAVDPLWYGIGQSSQLLDSRDAPTLRYVAARLKSTGQWDDLGLTADPAAGGEVHNIVYNRVDGKWYIGGDWTNLDNDAVLGADYIARYDPVTEAWENVGGVSALNGIVYAMAVAPNGDVYVGGTFTDAGGNKDYIACYDLSADAWVAVGNPLAGGATITAIYDMKVDQRGLLWIGGEFTQIGGVANTAYVAYWDGSAYNALGTGMNAAVWCVTADSDNNIWFGGDFTQASGTASVRLAVWNSSATWTRFATGANGIVATIEHDAAGGTTIGGAFTTIDGNAYPYLARYQPGGGWKQIGGSPNLTIQHFAYAPDGLLYAVGWFTEIGDLDSVNLAARWNGGSWSHLDSGLFGSPVLAVACGPADPEIATDYDIWIGASGSAVTAIAGSETVTNDGTVNAYPVITVKRSGGTAAALTNIRNETTGKTLLFNYYLIDGETLTIDLDPRRQSITSDFFGPRWDAALPACDLGSFYLQPGDNQITCLVGTTGSPTVTAYMVWRDAYMSAD